jgi:hypothetical protein
MAIASIQVSETPLVLYVLRRAVSNHELGPHPEELAKQASRRMAAWHRPAAILRDAREGALLRMRAENAGTGF